MNRVEPRSTGSLGACRSLRMMYRRPDFLIDEPSLTETVGEAARTAARLHDPTSRYWDGTRWKLRASDGDDTDGRSGPPAHEGHDDAHLRSVAHAVARFGASATPVFKVTRPTVSAG